MSDLLIKGMEMPKTGLYFVSVDNTDGRDKTVLTVGRMLDNRDVRQIIGSYEAVSVPPHGRLIDADALLDSDGDIWDGMWGYSGVQIVDAPTIIPASEEVYARYTDTAGNTHWTGTRTGEHIIPASKEGE